MHDAIDRTHDLIRQAHVAADTYVPEIEPAQRSWTTELIAERRMEVARENYETAIEDYLYVRTHGSSRRSVDARTSVSDEQITSAVARIKSRIE